MNKFAFILCAMLFLELPACRNKRDADCVSADPAKLSLVGGEFRSTKSFLYGSYKANIMPTQMSGIISSFFLYDGASKEHEEFDFEFIGSSGRMNMNLRQKMSNNITTLAIPLYSLEDGLQLEIQWTPRKISWLVGGNLVREEYGVFNKAKTIHFNLWGSAYCPWAGELELPWRNLDFKYVVKSFTYSPYSAETNAFSEPIPMPFTLSNFTSSNIALEDSLGTDWISFCGTFDEFNVTLFHPNNVLAEGKQVILKMSPIPLQYRDDRDKVKGGFCPEI